MTNTLENKTEKDWKQLIPFGIGGVYAMKDSMQGKPSKINDPDSVEWKAYMAYQVITCAGALAGLAYVADRFL